MRTKENKDARLSTQPRRPRVVLIENNPLTVWAIQRTLAAGYDLATYATLEAARAELEGSGVQVVICGSPIADGSSEAIMNLAPVAGRRVIALVSNPDCRIPAYALALEKPFDLDQLVALMAEGPSDHGPSGNGAEPTVAERLRTRFKDEVCRVCVYRTAGGGCALATHVDWLECPVFEWADRLAALVESMQSDRLGDYIDQVRAIICPTCMQRPDGSCDARDHLDCPLDLYMGLVVPIVEEEAQRVRASRGLVPSAPPRDGVES